MCPILSNISGAMYSGDPQNEYLEFTHKKCYAKSFGSIPGFERPKSESSKCPDRSKRIFSGLISL